MQIEKVRAAAAAAVAFVPGIIWGASFLFIAEGLEILPPMGVTFVRIALGFATLGLFPAARRPLGRDEWPEIAMLGLTWFAFPLAIFPLAERYVSSALTGLLNGATPLFAVIVAAIIARRPPSRTVLGALSVGLGGLALIAAPTLGQGENAFGSVLLILAALVSYGFAINLAAPLQRRHGALPVIWRALGVALLLTAPFGGPALLEFRWSTIPVLCLLALGVLGTSLANVLMATVAGKFGAGAASSTNFVIPAVAALLGVLLRHESIATASLVGGGLCLVAAWLLSRAPAPSAASRFVRSNAGMKPISDRKLCGPALLKPAAIPSHDS